MRAVGYRQVYLYLKNKIKKDDLSDKIIFATRQLAKRQMTWMRKKRWLLPKEKLNTIYTKWIYF